VTDLAGRDKIAVQRIANTCVTYFRTCQDLCTRTRPATTAARSLRCTRSAGGTVVVG
jgi:hypothetical protein